MVTVDELRRLFGPMREVASLGSCIVIPGDKFDPDWEADLGDQGFKCFSIDLDAHPVTLVQLNKIVSKSGVVFVPPKTPAVVPEVHSNDVEVKETEKVEKKVYALKGPAWTDEDEAELLKEYDRLVSEGKKWGCSKIITDLPRFKGRSVSAIDQKLKRLRKCRKGEAAAGSQGDKVDKVEEAEQVAKVEMVEKKTHGNPHPKMPWLKDAEFWSLEEDALIVELWKKGLTLAEIGVEVNKKYPKRVGKAAVARVYQLQGKGLIEKRHKPKLTDAKALTVTKGDKSPDDTSAIKSQNAPVAEKQPEFEAKADNASVEKRLQILSEAYESLRKGYVDLKTDFLRQQEFIVSSMATVGSLNDVEANLRKDLARHEHAVSGKVMVPMEASQ